MPSARIYKRAHFFTFLLFVGGIGTLYYHVTETPRTVEELAQTPPSQSQRRTSVAKDIYLQNAHYHIEAPNSTLTYIPHSEGRHLIEHLKEISFSATQNEEVRTFTSPEGEFDFTSLTFFAQDLDLSFYHLLETNPYLTGIAESVAVDFHKASGTFDADMLHLDIDLDTDKENSHVTR